MRLLILTLFLFLARPADESRRFPKANLISSSVVEQPIMGKSFLPAGNLAKYKKGARTYELFLVKAATPNDAAILLLDYKKLLKDAKFIAHFGGYFGDDAGKPVFLFTKGDYLAGIAGLPQAEADALAREFAARL